MILKTDRHINLIVIHCADTYKRMLVGAKEITQWHVDRGWSDCGYHFIINRFGTVETGRNLNVSGAHARGYNKNSIGICLVGGRSDNDKPEDNFTAEQKKTLAALIINLQIEYPNADIKGHNQLSNKSCPNFNVKDFMSNIDIHLFN
tara:strand:- start:600 stop:1040 length:441 start_codon:yes stop_codon:yes gene_type:complete